MTGDPFRDNPFAPQSQTFQPWEQSKTGIVRDLVFVPAPGCGELKRGESYLQVITWELSEDETELVLMFHTSGQIVRILGVGLSELADLVVEKKVRAVRVFDAATHGTAPAKHVTAVQFGKTFGNLLGNGE